MMKLFRGKDEKNNPGGWLQTRRYTPQTQLRSCRRQLVTHIQEPERVGNGQRKKREAQQPGKIQEQGGVVQTTDSTQTKPYAFGSIDETRFTESLIWFQRLLEIVTQNLRSCLPDSKKPSYMVSLLYTVLFQEYVYKSNLFIRPTKLDCVQSQSCGFSSSHVCMWELDHKEGWVPKNWCFWTVVLKKTLRVPWTAGRSNQSILKEISPECSLEGLMLRLKRQSFGHLMQRADLLEKTLILRKIEGRRRGGDRG